MRAIAALSVVLYHVSFSFPAITDADLWGRVSSRNVGQPMTGVVLFFVISGFVLYRPFVAARYAGRPLPNVRSYAVRRVARIVPAYWVALAIATLWVPLPAVEHFTGVVKYFGFMQVYGSLPNAVLGLGVAWSLCVEATFYAALPLIALAARRLLARRSRLGSELTMCATLALIALVYQVAVLNLVSDPDQKLLLVLMTLPGSLDLFAAGMLLAVASVELSYRPVQPRWVQIVDRAPWLPWLLAIGVYATVPRAAGIAGWGGFAGYVPSQWLKALFSALLLMPAVFGELRHGWLRRILGWRPILWLGGISYGIYLWHTPLLTKLQSTFVPDGRVATILVLLGSSVTVAALSFYLLERPAQRLARRYLVTRSATRAQPIPIVASAPIADSGSDRGAH